MHAIDDVGREHLLDDDAAVGSEMLEHHLERRVGGDASERAKSGGHDARVSEARIGRRRAPASEVVEQVDETLEDEQPVVLGYVTVLVPPGVGVWDVHRPQANFECGHDVAAGRVADHP